MGFWLPLRRRDKGLTITTAPDRPGTTASLQHLMSLEKADLSAGSAAEGLPDRREPLVGREAVLPVPETVRHWHASPRSAVEFLVRAATLDGQQVGPRRTLSMPGLSATVGEQIEALRRVAGEQAVRLIRREPDESIMRVVETWATALEATRAVRLGFAAASSFDEIIRVHIDDELGGSL